jgi:hypothetical protein
MKVKFFDLIMIFYRARTFGNTPQRLAREKNIICVKI